MTPPGLFSAGCGAGSWSSGRVWFVESRGAVGISSVVVVVGAGPLVRAGSGDAVAPGGVGLESVVGPAERGEVVGGRGSGLWPVFCCGVVVERDDVVDVAAAGGSGAPGEHAGAASSR